MAFGHSVACTFTFIVAAQMVRPNVIIFLGRFYEA